VGVERSALAGCQGEAHTEVTTWSAPLTQTMGMKAHGDDGDARISGLLDHPGDPGDRVGRSAHLGAREWRHGDGLGPAVRSHASLLQWQQGSELERFPDR
jgi:hypothetical protein